MAGVAVELRDRGVRQALGGMRQRLDDFTPAMKLIGIHMLRSVRLNFDAGGRPTPWTPSKRALREGGKTLLDTGQLAGSITMRADRTSVRLSTAKVYARPHQLGAAIRHARGLKVRQKRGRGVTRVRKVTITQRTGGVIRLPARPFLMVQDEDTPIIRGILRDYLAGRGA